MTFEQFFTTATRGYSPYDYQRRLAEDSACLSRLIEIPTGLGKTAAAVLTWLWNRVHLPRQNWPRRLVYCLPMRTLVEQTEKNVHDWLEALLQAGMLDREIGVHILMGGEVSSDWDIHPEREAILIGTQDMLLSRALNRGYAAGRARWPKDFALLNNDCLWVFDEVQLMSTGFATSLQLQAWREREGSRPALRTFSWWMSATVEKAWLESAIDFIPAVSAVWDGAKDRTKLLWETDILGQTASAQLLKRLLKAGTKRFHPTPEAILKVGEEAKYIDAVARAVRKLMAKHGGRKGLVILNSVRRACALAAELESEKPLLQNEGRAQGAFAGALAAEFESEKPLLLHSRFRHRERKAWIAKLKSANLIIATQVIEAGLDISSRVLFTELCPWPSFIQRCGRAARYADQEADIYWLDVSKDPLPYSEGEMAAARDQFDSLSKDVSLFGFRTHRETLSKDNDLAHRLLPYSPRFVPQAKDLLDLFDTTPDLTGADIDISRYIRDGEEHDITVFWRDCSTIPKGKNPPKAKSWQPEHAELCPVPVRSRDFEFRDFVQKAQGRIWRWDYRDGWTLLNRGDNECIFPGQVFLLEQACGGYHPEKGWTGRAEDQYFDLGPWRQPKPQPLAPEEFHENPAGTGDNSESSNGSSNSGEHGAWRSILQHSQDVCEELENQLAALLPESAADEDARAVLPLAARLHDWGKAHAAFKQKIKRVELEEARASGKLPDGFSAKAPDKCWRRDKLGVRSPNPSEAEPDERRAGFRHELASALAILELLRRHQPDHPALAWPDAELRDHFGFPSPEVFAPLQDDALAKEIAALSVPQFNLLLYLVAAHHGKVRLSLRSSPDDLRDDVPWPCPPDTRQARGVRERDPLPAVALPGSDFASSAVHTPALTLHLEVMDLGLSAAYGPSWRERTGALLAALGPFRLAWYEALLRVADQRASKRAEANETNP